MTKAMPSTVAAHMMEVLHQRVPHMVEHLRQLVSCESPSDDLEATARCGEVLTRIASELTGVPPQIVTSSGRPHYLWRFGPGPTKVLLLGHLDTVWPSGTLDRWPFQVEGDRATGPGCFDMKAGLVQALHAVSVLADTQGVALLVTCDEELGSQTSRTLIEEQAAGAAAVFVLEASADGALKTQRKGASLYEVAVLGRAAHAGLEPEKGVNAAVELAHQTLAVLELRDTELGTTVTPTVVRGGTTTNTVPHSAALDVDVRVGTLAEQTRVDKAFRALRGQLAGARVTVTGGPNRPPLEAVMSETLFADAQRLASDLGLPALQAKAVGGASDGNFTAGAGVPTLDGLGAVGDHAHAEGEYILISAMPQRAALLAALIESVCSGTSSTPTSQHRAIRPCAPTAITIAAAG